MALRHRWQTLDTIAATFLVLGGTGVIGVFTLHVIGQHSDPRWDVPPFAWAASLVLVVVGIVLFVMSWRSSRDEPQPESSGWEDEPSDEEYWTPRVLSLAKDARSLSELKAVSGLADALLDRIVSTAIAAGTAIPGQNEQGELTVRAVPIGQVVEHDQALPITPLKRPPSRERTERTTEAEGIERTTWEETRRGEDVAIRAVPAEARAEGIVPEQVGEIASEKVVLERRCRDLAGEIGAFVRTRRIERPELNPMFKVVLTMQTTTPSELSRYDNETRILFEEQFMPRIVQLGKDLVGTIPEDNAYLRELRKDPNPRTIGGMHLVRRRLERLADLLAGSEGE